MDAACTIQDSIHVFSLVHKYVSRILGTYQLLRAFLIHCLHCLNFFGYEGYASSLSSRFTTIIFFLVTAPISSNALSIRYTVAVPMLLSFLDAL